MDRRVGQGVQTIGDGYGKAEERRQGGGLETRKRYSNVQSIAGGIAFTWDFKYSRLVIGSGSIVWLYTLEFSSAFPTAIMGKLLKFPGSRHFFQASFLTLQTVSVNA